MILEHETNQLCKDCAVSLICHSKTHNRKDLRKQLKKTGQCPEFKSVYKNKRGGQ